MEIYGGGGDVIDRQGVELSEQAFRPCGFATYGCSMAWVGIAEAEVAIECEVRVLDL
jgi:hypothetical protein